MEIVSSSSGAGKRLSYVEPFDDGADPDKSNVRRPAYGVMSALIDAWAIRSLTPSEELQC